MGAKSSTEFDKQLSEQETEELKLKLESWFDNSSERKIPQTLEERQVAWDEEHTGRNADFNMERYKYGRPARPTEEQDELIERCSQPNKANGSSTEIK